MGLVDNITKRVSTWFGSSSEAETNKLKKGVDDGSGDRNAYGLNTGLGAFDELSKALSLDQDLMSRFADYEEMDDYPEISSSIDIYADDATIPDSTHNKTVWVTSKERIISDILDNLFVQRLRIENDIHALARTLVKYGNAYAEIVANESGVIGLNFMSPATVRRVEDVKGNLIGFVQDTSGGFSISVEQVKQALEKGESSVGRVIVFEPWEVVHWRLQGKNISSEYGHSVLDSARWIWRRLVMAEDSALIYKLTRAPSRYAFYVDVGDLPQGQAMGYVNQVKSAYKKRKLFNTSNGKIDFRRNPLGMDEDFWIPVRNGQESTRIDTISGPDYQAIEDLEYFRSKLFSALKVPRSYLGLESDVANRALSQEDVRFARTVMRIQREIRNGLKQVCRIHLAALNVDPDQIDFEIKMSVPSQIFELAQIEMLNARGDAADRMSEYFPKEWIMKYIFDLSSEDAITVVDQKKDENRDAIRRETEIQAELLRDFPQVMGGTVDIGAKTTFSSPQPMSDDVQSIAKRLERLENELQEIDKRSNHMYNVNRQVGQRLNEMERFRKNQTRQNRDMLLEFKKAVEKKRA